MLTTTPDTDTDTDIDSDSQLLALERPQVPPTGLTDHRRSFQLAVGVGVGGPQVIDEDPK
jgi:hypothetical protein